MDRASARSARSDVRRGGAEALIRTESAPGAPGRGNRAHSAREMTSCSRSQHDRLTTYRLVGIEERPQPSIQRPAMTQQKITPCLWFDFKAEEAVARQPRCDDLALWRY